jgi:hypothetical protein
MTGRRFFWLWLAGSLAILTLAAAVNLIVDPYGVYGLVRIVGVNDDKTAAVAQSRMAKHYLVERVHPATLLIGSSRVEAGLDPESDAWPQDLRPVFNMGSAGTGPHSQLRLLQDSLAAAQPRLVVIGTDFIESLTADADLAASSSARGSLDFEQRPRVTKSGAPNDRVWLAQMQDVGSTLFSLSAIGDSIATLLTQRSSKYSKFTPLGRHTLTEFNYLVQTEGEYSLFLAKDRFKVAQVVPMREHYQFAFAPLAQAIAEALRHGAQVIVVITPGHADELEIYRQAGVMSVYEEWRQRLTEIVTDAGGGKVALWDFAGLTPYTTETVPGRGDTKSQLSWFWETNHFKEALGDLMISRILGHGPQGFGDQLTLITLPRARAELRKQQYQYVKAQPAAVARVSSLIAERLDRVCKDDAPRCRPAREQIANASLRDSASAEPDDNLDQLERRQ